MNLTAVSSSTDGTSGLVAFLIDPDDDTRHRYAARLKQAAYRVHEASDGRDALARALAHRLDVIVTETRIPGIDGYRLCELLRHDPATRHVPIVVITADAYPTDLDRARRAGADLVLVKPCSPETLLAELQRLNGEPDGGRPPGASPEPNVGSPVPTEPGRHHAGAGQGRQILSRTHDRGVTRTPPLPAPAVLCPVCDQPLRYMQSHVGGVSARHPEQWDEYACAAGCGTFQYRQRTRKLRRV